MKIVFSPAISPAAWAIGPSLLPRGFTIEILVQEPERRNRQMEEADFLMGFLRGMPLRPDDYPHLRNVKLIQVLSAGYDGVDLERLRRSGIPLANNGGADMGKLAQTLGQRLRQHRARRARRGAAMGRARIALSGNHLKTGMDRIILSKYLCEEEL